MNPCDRGPSKKLRVLVEGSKVKSAPINTNNRSATRYGKKHAYKIRDNSSRLFNAHDKTTIRTAKALTKVDSVSHGALPLAVHCNPSKSAYVGA